MAYKDNTIQWSGGLGEKVFSDGYFNIDDAVGADEVGTNRMAGNMVTDMQLVFYFSFIIYRHGDKQIFPTTDNDRFSLTPPQRDYTSNQTKDDAAGMIWRFQGDLKRRGKRIYQDGRCDPAHTKISSLSKTAYTILMYNFYYEHTVRTAFGVHQWQEHLMNDQLLPEQVRWELRFRSFPYSWM